MGLEPAAGAASASVSAPGDGLPVGAEIASLRTASSKTFVGPHGTLQAHIYPVAVNYKDANGDWQPIDDTLVPGTDGALAGYINGANRLHVELPKVLGTAPVHVSDGPQWLRFSLDGGTGLGSTSGSTETFANALPGVDLTYSMTNTALKENLILAGPTSPQSFSYTVSTSADLTARSASDGSIAFVDGSGTPKFSFLAPVMSDAAGQDSRASYSLTTTPTGYTVTLNADTAWLNSPDRVWPVTIDPTVPDDSGYYPTTGSLSPTSDGYLVDGANASQNFFGLTVDKVGWNSSNIRHGLFQFNAEGALPAGAQVLDAELKLYLSSESTTATASVGVYQMVTDPWTSSATWNTYDGTHSWTTAGGDYTSDSLGHAWATSTVGGSSGTGFYYNWQITQLVAGWSGSTMPDHGLLVKDVNETTNANVFSFNSSHATSNLPYISVQYEYGVGSRPTYTFSDFPLADTMSGSVNVGNGNLLLCQTDLSLPGSDGFDLTLNRCLNSLTQGDVTNQNEQLDTNWTMTPGQATYLDSVNGNLVYHDDNGDLVPFTQDGSGAYVNATAFNGSLSLTSGTLAACSSHSYGYVLTFDADGSKQYFSGTTGRLQAEADANGNTICFTYGSNIYGTGTILTSITDSQGRTITFNYINSNLTLSSITWSGSNCTGGTCTISYGYDANNDLTSVTDPSGAQTIYGYNASKQLTSVQDADGNTTSFAYTLINGYGPAVSSITDANGKQTTFSYNVAGSLCTSPATETDVTDPKSGVTHYCHDNGLRVSETKAPDGTITQTAWTTTSQTANCVDQYGDSLDNQPCSSQDGNQHTSQESYSSTTPQNLTSETDGLDANGNCPSGATCPTISYTYGDSSHPFFPTRVTVPADGNGHQHATAYTYDTNGNVLSQTTGLNADGTCPSGSTCPTTTYTYDGNGNQTSVTDPDGHATQSLYDANNQLTCSQSGLTAGSSSGPFVCNVGNVSTDRFYCPSGKTCPTTTYTYDGNGNQTSVTDPDGHATQSLYDANNQLTCSQSGLTAGSSSGPFVCNVGNVSTDRFYCPAGKTCPTTTYTYDGNGNQTSVTDPDGHATQSIYDNNSQLTCSQSGLTAGSSSGPFVCNVGNVTTDAFYCPAGKTCPTTTYGFDAAGNQVAVTDPDGHATQSLYDNNNQLTCSQSGLTAGSSTGPFVCNVGNVSTDAFYCPAGKTCPTTTTSYDSAGNQTSVTDPNGHATQSLYDNNNQLTCSQSGLTAGSSTGPFVCNVGNVTTDQFYCPSGKTCPTTTTSYDSAGNQTSVTDPNGHATQSLYDNNNQLTCSQSGLTAGSSSGPFVCNVGNVSTDAFYCPATKTCPTTATTYDSAGNQTSVTDPNGHATQSLYDNNNQLTCSQSGLTAGSSSGPFVCNVGNVLTDAFYCPSGKTCPTTTNTYDANGNQTSVTDPDGHATQSIYDNNNQLTCSQSGLTAGSSSGPFVCNVGNVSTDAFYCPSGKTCPSTTYAYDADGNTTTKTEPSNATVTHVYDNNNHLVTTSYSDTTPTVSYTYDASGNRLSMTDGAGTVNYTYDNDNQRLSSTRGTDTFSYAYDAAGNVTSRTYPGGTNATYAYNNNESLSSVTSGTNATSYTYDPAGNPLTRTLPNGYVETSTYDNAGRRTEINNAKSGTTLSDYTYTYDAAGNPLTVAQSGAVSGTTLYQYDNNGQLVDACYQATTCNETQGSQDPYIHYTYDGNGNRLTEARPSGTTTSTYNNTDELTSAGSTNYTYDANGNETSAGSQTFTYNAANQLTSTTNGTTTSYTYDGDGNRLTKNDNGTTTNYLWDTNGALPQEALYRDSSNNVLSSYIYGNERVSMNSGGSDYYYLYDSQGSVVNVTSATGATEWTYSYEPFGATRTQTKNDPNAPSNPMQYSGELRDPTTGLYDLRARQYDSSTGRFLSQDPLATNGPTGGTYVYANDNPNIYNDPTGDCYRGIGWGNGSGAAIIHGHFVQGQSQAVKYNENVTDDMARYQLCRKVNNVYLAYVRHHRMTNNTQPAWNHVQKVLGAANPNLWYPDPVKLYTFGDFLHAAGNYIAHHKLDITIGIASVVLPELAVARVLVIGGRTIEAVRALRASRVALDALDTSGKEELTLVEHSSILRSALRQKGDFGLGSVSTRNADSLGRAWVGRGYRVASDGKTLVSKDGLRAYRPPSWKPKLGKYQANLEYRLEGQVTKLPFGNGHLDITDQP